MTFCVCPVYNAVRRCGAVHVHVCLAEALYRLVLPLTDITETQPAN
jgi:hypothetical protein